MINEPRSAKFGRFLAPIVDAVVERISGDRRETYVHLLGDELANFSFKPVPEDERGSTPSSRELEGVYSLCLEDPRMVARTLKEARHLNYQKGTSYNIMRGFLTHFQNGGLRSALDRMRDLPERHKSCEEDSYVYRDFP
jgi:hypothetical protein